MTVEELATLVREMRQAQAAQRVSGQKPWEARVSLVEASWALEARVDKAVEAILPHATTIQEGR